MGGAFFNSSGEEDSRKQVLGRGDGKMEVYDSIGGEEGGVITLKGFKTAI